MLRVPIPPLPAADDAIEAAVFCPAVEPVRFGALRPLPPFDVSDDDAEPDERAAGVGLLLGVRIVLAPSCDCADSLIGTGCEVLNGWKIDGGL